MDWKTTAKTAIGDDVNLFYWSQKPALVAQRIFVPGHSAFGSVAQLNQDVSIVNITGTAVTWVSGAVFDPAKYGLSDCTINGVPNWNRVNYVDSTHLTLATAVPAPLTNATLTVYAIDNYGSDGGQDQSVVTILDLATQSLCYNIAMSFTSIWVPDAAAVNSQHQGTGTIAGDGVTLTWASGAKFLKRWQNQPVQINGGAAILFRYIYSDTVVVLDTAQTPGACSWALSRLHACAGYDQLIVVGGNQAVYGATGVSINMRTTDQFGTAGTLDTQVGISINQPSRGANVRPRLNYGLFIADQSGLLEGSVFYSGATSANGSVGDWAILTNRGLVNFGDDVTIQKTNRSFDTAGTIWNSTINILSAHGGSYANFSGPAGQTRGFGYQTFTPTTPGATPDLNSEAGTSYFRWFLGCTNATESSTDGVGSDFFLQRYHNDGSGWDVPLLVRRADGSTVVTGLTIIQATAAVQLSVLSGGADSAVLLGGPAGHSKTIDYATLVSGNYLPRWTVATDTSAEAGSNAGTNFVISRYNDAGTLIDNPISINRATGAVIINGTTIGGSSSTLTGANLVLEAAAGTAKTINLESIVSSVPLLRWQVASSSAAESGSNAGSDFAITRFDDSGAPINTELAINRATGDVTLAHDLYAFTGHFSADLHVAANAYAANLTITGSGVVSGNLGVTGNVSAANLYDKTYVDATFATIASLSGYATVASLSGYYAHGADITLYDVSGASKSITLTTTVSGSNLLRWQLASTNGAEAGSNAGSDFAILRANDAGTYIDTPFSINRATGELTFAHDVHGASGFFANLTLTGAIGAASMVLSGSSTVGGNLGVTGNVSAANLYDKSTIDSTFATLSGLSALTATVTSLTGTVASLYTSLSGYATTAYVTSAVAAAAYDDSGVLASIASLSASVSSLSSTVASLYSALSGYATHGTYAVSGGPGSVTI